LLVIAEAATSTKGRGGRKKAKGDDEDDETVKGYDTTNTVCVMTPMLYGSSEERMAREELKLKMPGNKEVSHY